MSRFLALLACLAAPLHAWGMTATPIYCQTPKNNVVQFLQGTDGTGTYKTLVTAGTNGTACVGLWATNNDDATHTIRVQVVRSGVRYGGQFDNVIPATSGFAAGIPAVNLLAPSIWPGLQFDHDGNPLVLLQSGDTLDATYTALFTTAGELVNLVAECCDF